MKRYDPKTIEPKWQQYWQDNKTYQADLDSDKPKYIAMSMFNYPSGMGIHVGHAMNYTISDVLARTKRQQGYESYHPVGWDSFGMPAENYAIKAGISPQESMAKIIPNYHKQYQAMGWSNDWSKEIAAHTPEYYRWSQWIFSQMHRHGLAYQDARMQWWCDKCQTVLANEQVIDGKCWRHDSADDPEVQQKEIKQWFFKITDYADELLEATDDLDWTEHVKTSQKNWIGRSEGAIIKFKLGGLGSEKHHLEVFTTAHDTIYGVTFMVLAPEHPMVAMFAQYADNSEIIDEYVQKSLRKSNVDREKDKTKSGVPIEGLHAVNPANGTKVPVWVADYVLMDYGTGAIMAVPGQDERDFEFATKYDLPIVYTSNQQKFISYQDIKANPKEYAIANSDEFDGMDFAEAKPAILKKLVDAGQAEATVNYKMKDWSVSRQRYWGAPIPIVYCGQCGPVLLPDDQLPVVLPELEDFAPSGDGRSALARAKDWLRTSCPDCGGEATRETDTLDTYICSSWYMLRYFDPHNKDEAFSKDRADKWAPIDFYNGADHATAHMIYARFVTRFFNKIGLIDHPEPFKKFLFNGKVMASDGKMFSKSKGNGVDPLEIINDGYGADALRTYLMFAAPLDQWVRWDAQGVPGAYRFLTRSWNLVQEYIDRAEEHAERGTVGDPLDVNSDLLTAVHKTIDKVTQDIDQLKYNTAIAAQMALVNNLHKLKEKDGYSSAGWQFALESLVQLLAPFAPHIAEEMWRQLGHEDTVHVDHWPEVDKKYLMTETITIPVQINGKVRGQIEVDPEAEKSDVLTAAKADDNVAKHLEGKTTKQEIYVKGRIVNLVV